MSVDQYLAEVALQQQLDDAQNTASVEDYLRTQKGDPLQRNTDAGYLYDADTIYQSGEGKRLLGGDAPEIRTAHSSAMPLSVEAQERARGLIQSGAYKYSETGEKGRRGRDLASFRDENGNSVMGQLIREGYASPTSFGGSAETNYAEGEAINARFDAQRTFSETGTTPALERMRDYGVQRPELTTTVKDSRNFVGRAWDRGTDLMHMNLFQFTELVGDVVGSDTAKQWGEEGVLRNMIEAGRSPVEVESTDDVKDLETLGKYIVERVVENAPNFLADIGIAAGAASATALTGGVAAPAVYAAIGKSFTMRLGWRAAGKLGFTGSMYAQMTGESRHAQLEQGVDNPLLAFGTGAIKTGAEMYGLQSILKGFMPKGRITDAAGLAKHIGYQATLNTGIEGGTEFIQDLTDQLAIKMAKPGYEVDWNQLNESFWAGAAAGGGTSTVTATAGAAYSRYQQLASDAQQRRAMDGTVPEAPSQIQAQVDHFGKSGNQLKTVYSADPDMPNHITLPKGVKAYRHESGAVFTSDPIVGAAFKEEGLTDAKTTLGYTQDKTEVGKNKVEDVRLVEYIDDQGNEIVSQVATVDRVEDTKARLRATYGKDAKIVVQPAEAIAARLEERQRRYQEEIQALNEKRRTFVPQGESKVGLLHEEPKKQGTSFETLRDTAGKLRPLKELLAALSRGDLDPEAIKLEAAKLQIDSVATEKSPIARDKLIRAIIEAEADATPDRVDSLAKTAKQRKMQEEYSDEQLVAEARKAGVEPENPKHILSDEEVDEDGNKKGGASSGLRVASAILQKLERAKNSPNDDRSAYIGASFARLGALLGIESGLDKQKGEDNNRYAARVLARLRQAASDKGKIAEVMAEAIDQQLSPYEQSELADHHFLHIARSDEAITHTQTNMHRLVKEIIDRSHQSDRSDGAKPTPKSKKETDKKAARKQKKQRKVAELWETLRYRAVLMMDKHLPRTEKGTYAFTPDINLTETQDAQERIAIILDAIDYDSDATRAQMLDQLLKLRTFQMQVKHSRDNSKAVKKNVKGGHVAKREDRVMDAIRLLNSTKKADAKNIKQFINLLDLVFNDRNETAEMKEAARGAETVLQGLALEARHDIDLIERLMPKVFNRTAFRAAYMADFEKRHGSRIKAAMAILARSKKGVSPDALYKQFVKELRLGVTTQKNDRLFFDPNVQGPNIERHIALFESIVSGRHAVDGVDVSLTEIVQNIFKVHKDMADVLLSLRSQGFINSEMRAIYRPFGKSAWEKTGPISADTSGISEIVETNDPERASIHQFFHAIHRGVMRFRRALRAENQPLLPQDADKDTWVTRLQRFAAIRKPKNEWADKKLVTLDFETFFDTASGYSLADSNMTAEKYIDDKRFEVLGLAVHIDGESKYLTSDKEIRELLDTLRKDDSVALVMHNGQFDAQVLQRRFGYAPKQYVDTMALSMALHPDRRYGHKLKDVAMGLFPDNAELHKLESELGTDLFDGLRAADIANAGISETVADYAKQDAAATQAIAEKLLPYFPADELHYMSERLNFITTGKNRLLGEGLHDGMFGDASERGKFEGHLIMARTEALGGANLLHVRYDDGFTGERDYAVDAHTIANYRKDGHPVDVVMALETLMTNLARMALGSQPRLHDPDVRDLNRRFALPKSIPDSLVIFQNDRGEWQTVGDARKVDAYRQSRRKKADDSANFLETVDEKLAELYKKLESVRDQFEDQDTAAEAAAYSYLSDLINTDAFNRAKVETNRKQHEAESTKLFSDKATLERELVPNSLIEREVDPKKGKRVKDDERETSLDSRWASHATLAERLLSEQQEIHRLREAIKAEESVDPNDKRTEKQRNERNESLREALVVRLDIHNELRVLANSRLELGTVADYADEDATVEEINALIEGADTQAALSEILGTYSQIKQAHQGKYKVADEAIYAGGLGQDSGDSMMDIESGTQADAEAVDKGSLNIEADSRFKDSNFFDNAIDPLDKAVMESKDGATPKAPDSDNVTEENTEADKRIADGWVHEIPVRQEGWVLSGVLNTLAPTTVVPYAPHDTDVRRETAPTRTQKTSAAGATYFVGHAASMTYRVYGNAWSNPNKSRVAGPAKRVSGAANLNNRRRLAAARRAKYFGAHKIKNMGVTIPRLLSILPDLLRTTLNIQTPLAVMSTDNMQKSIDDMVAKGIVPAAKGEALKERLKSSAKKKRPAYINTGEFAIIMLPPNDPATTYVQLMHEVGHMVYDHSWENATPAQQQLVANAFAKDRANYGEESFSGAFKEWFADQVAHAVTRTAYSANTTRDALSQQKGKREQIALGRFFKNILYKLGSIWDVMSKLAGLTRSKASPEFGDFLDSVISNQDTKINTQKGIGQALNMSEAKTKHRRPTHQIWRKVAERAVANVAQNFKRLDKQLSQMLYQATGGEGAKSGEKSYENLHLELERRFLGMYSTAMSKIGKAKQVRQAFDDLNAGRMTEGAQILRKMADAINAEAKLHMPDLRIRENMVPQAFDHLAIESKRKQFIALLRTRDPFKYLSEAELNARVDYLLDGQGFNERTIAPGMPVGSHSFTDLVLTTFSAQELGDYLLHEPDAVMYHFISTVAKRAAWESTFGEWVTEKGKQRWSPNKRWLDAMERVNATHGAAGVKEAHDLLDSVFGRTGANMPQRARKFQEDGLNFVNMMILAFSGVASIPELGISVTRAANMLSVKEMFTGMGLREARRYGMDIGSVISDGLQQIQAASVGEAYKSSISHKAASLFFKANGQQLITRVSRTLATSLGIKYVQKIADFNQIAELNALHISGAQVKRWVALGKPAFVEGLNEADARAVRAVNGAILQFVNESSLHPSKFQNTSWMNNPYLRVAAHLKQFLWAITSTLLMGTGRVAMRRFSDARGEGLGNAAVYAVMPFIVGGVAIAALTMLSVELREEIKGRDRTQHMDAESYASEILNRSGSLGAFEMAVRVYNADHWSDVPNAVVPVYGYGQGFFKDNLTWQEALRKITPFFAQNKDRWVFD